MLLLLLTTAALIGIISLCKQPSCTGKKINPETAGFEWIGLPNGLYLCI